MGTWTLESTKSSVAALNTATNFGHTFKVTYRLKYTPKLGQGFSEPPQLDWHERILYKNLKDRTWWEFETNMYTHKPSSATLRVWMCRYLAAYRVAASVTPVVADNAKGTAQLLAKDGKPIPVATLGAGLATPEAQVKAVRDYLQSRGGILEVQIHDIPSISLPLRDEANTERLLIFNCGLVGVTTNRVRAEQLLIVNHAQPKASWTQSFKIGAGHDWATRGYNKVATPAGVSTPGTQFCTKDVEYF